MVESSFFVYDFCDATKHVQDGGYNREKDVEALRKKLNCLAFGVIIHSTHANYFCYDNLAYMIHQNIRYLCLSLDFAICKEWKSVLCTLAKHQSYLCEVIVDHIIIICLVTFTIGTKNIVH